MTFPPFNCRTDGSLSDPELSILVKAASRSSKTSSSTLTALRTSWVDHPPCKILDIGSGNGWDVFETERTATHPRSLSVDWHRKGRT